MPRTSSSAKSSEKEVIPQWIEEEIRSIQFTESEILNRTGYILEIYQDDYKLDIQLYEALPDGRTIVEGIDIPSSQDISKFMKGFVYEFKIKMSWGKLSENAIEFLKSQFMVDMDSIYQFELIELQLMDVESEENFQNSLDDTDDS
ncbi:MAG TPA: hypothetical protein VHJ38_00630 [Nitrososphaeraceae archaeon]|jgi:hypothetical protein|nr:hypothetical protein [Nitrososphaeraceae archaeon]